MFYAILDGISEITFQDINPDILTIGLIELEELEQYYESLGFSSITLAECKNGGYHIHGTLNSYYDYLFGIIIAINPHQIIRLKDRLGLYIKKNLILFIMIEDKDKSSMKKLVEIILNMNFNKLSQERLLFVLLERFISEDYGVLEKIEDELTHYEDLINDGKLENNFNSKVTELRKKLMIMDNYFQQFIDIGEELEENPIDIFNNENLHYFKVFESRAERSSNNTRMLQEYSDHVREAYHAQLEYDLNRIMKIFTVVTTIFLPLTLIVGWYGMNFKTMPEISWRYGYLFVVILCVIVAVICLVFFKKKKFM